MIEYREGNRLDPAALAELFRSSGLRRPVDDLPRIARMYERLAVDARYQCRGIGRELIRRTLQRAPGTDCVLRSSAVAQDYYPHLGFHKVENGWFWPGREGKAPPRHGDTEDC